MHLVWTARRSLLALAAGLALAPDAAPLPTAAAPPTAALPAAAGDAWVEVRTPRLRVFSNAGEAAATRAARRLERLADVVERTTSGLRADGGREVRAYLFRDEVAFRPYSSVGSDDYGTTVGFHVTGEDAEYIAYFPPPDRSADRFAAHEFTHAVMHRSLGPLPIWADEGLAEYYSTCEMEKDGATVGSGIPQHALWLREHQLGLRYILLLSGENPDYTRGPNRETIYAQSWALVHTLIMDPVESGERFGRLIDLLGRGAASQDAFARIYGPGAIDSLEGRMRLFGREGLPILRFHFDAADQAPATVRRLDEAETHAVLGELLAHQEEVMAGLARRHLESAWARDSTRTLAAAVLAEMAIRARDEAAASRWIAAVERSSVADPRAFGLAGAALVRRSLARKEAIEWPARGAGEDAMRARLLLDRALAAQPGKGEWLAQWGMTFLDDTTGHNFGLGALMQAREDAPRRGDVVGSMALLNLRLGNLGAARLLYRELPRWGRDASWRPRVASAIGSATHGQVEERLRAHDFAAAESLVVRLRRDVADAGMPSYCDGMMRWIAETKQHGRP